MAETELREKLAAIEHRRWADWQRWMHKEVGYKVDGALWIPAKDVERWEVQISQSYYELSDREKASDMEQVDRYWPLIEDFVQRQVIEARKDEIGGVQLEYGPYVATTYVTGEAITVEERHATLTAQLSELEGK